MPLAPAVIEAIIGAAATTAGGAISNTSSATQTSTPTVAPAYQPLQAQILQMVKDRLQNPVTADTYAKSAAATLGKSYDAASGASENALTSRGLARSPVAAIVGSRLATSRAGAIGAAATQAPLIARSAQAEDLGLGSNILSFGRGVTSTGTSQSGGGAAGAFTNLAGYLGYLQGKGVFGAPTAGAGGVLPSTQTVPIYSSGMPGGY